jgi:hypothetical protein
MREQAPRAAATHHIKDSVEDDAQEEVDPQAFGALGGKEIGLD